MTNTGSSSVTVFSASMVGAGFALDRASFPWTLAPGETQAVGVRFAPETSGPASASLSFVSNAANSPTVVGLSGTAVSPLAHAVTLGWQPSSSTIAGHNIYRSNTGGEPYARLNPSLEPGSSFVDDAVQSGATYHYVVTTVDGAGRESGYSTPVTAVIPTP